MSVSSDSDTSESMDEQDNQDNGEWNRVKYAIDHLKPGAPRVGDSGNEHDLKPAASAAADGAMGDGGGGGGGGGDEDALWQQALERYQKESSSRLIVENNGSDNFEDGNRNNDVNTSSGSIPSSIGKNNDRNGNGANPQSIEARMSMMDRMGPLDIEQPVTTGNNTNSNSNNNYNHSSTQPSNSASIDPSNLTLWQTFKLLYRRNRIIKFYLVGVLLLLIVTVVVIVIFVTQSSSNKSKSFSPEECAAAPWQDEPFTIQPEENKRSGPNGSLETITPGAFGQSIDATAKYLIVGAPYMTCSAKLSNGGVGQCKDFTLGGGAAIYSNTNNNSNNSNESHWTLHAKIYLDDGLSTGDQFGYSVSLSEDNAVAVMGAPMDDGLGVTAGAAYVAEAPFSSGVAPLRLVPDDIGVNDEFGGSVGVSVTMLKISSEDGSSNSVKVTNIVVGSASDDDAGANSGGVYVFSKYDGAPPPNACGGGGKVVTGKWRQCQKLLPDDGGTLDRFGRAVDISDKKVVVGADWDDDRGIDSGSAYVYDLADDGIWTFQQKILPTNVDPTSDRFGTSVAISGDRIVIGADLDNSYGNDAGAAYVYKLAKGVWKLESKLHPGDGDHSKNNCGSSVDISSDGRTIAVGCPRAPGGGVVHVYVMMEEGVWTKKDTLNVPSGYSAGGVNNLKLGHSVAVTPGDYSMVVSGYGELYGDVWSYAKDC